jgi:hypothetical protein
MRAYVMTSLRGVNGSRECAPDDRLRAEAIQASPSRRRLWIASLALAMTHKTYWDVAV